MTAAGNLFSAIPVGSDKDESFTELLGRPGLRIERILSTGQASPPGFWYVQPDGEWGLLVAGAPHLMLEGETQPRELKPGDWIDLPPHCRHRIEWTATDQQTIWLAVHYPSPH